MGNCVKWALLQDDQLASGTVALSIQCAELVGHESRLAERSLQHLASLRDLSIAHCKLAALPRHSLTGLSS